MVKYNCLICGTTPDKKSHHFNHKKTKKHKLQKENLTLKLQQKSKEELLSEYQETDVELIISKLENNIVETDEIEQIDEIDESSGLDLNDLIEQDFESIHKTSNKDALKDKIHEIHNFLRNNGAGYGMSALKVFNVLYGLKRIEQYDLFKTIDLEEKYKFSKLIEMSKKPENYNHLQIRIHEEYLGGLFGNNKLKKFLFYEIPENINGKTYARIIEYIEELTKIEDQTNTNLSGKIYEYFVGRDESAISELGAYFTNRLITNYIYNDLCPPELNDDGSVPTMIDMYGGSGGFTLGYINYLNDNFDINWKENVNSIYHFDVNEDVVKSAALEILCATQQIPNMGDNIHYRNAFTNNFYDQKYHYIFTNPPYGGDKISKTDTQLKNERILKYIKEKLNIKSKRDIDILRCNSDPYYKSMVQQYLNLEKFEKDFKQNVKNNNVNWDTAGGRAKKYCNQYSLSEKCKDKESMSLIIMMMLLEENGTAVGVLKEGVFFDSKYKILRKHLIQNFNVTHVVSVPQDQFENTSTKTSIIVFKNTEQKTTNIKFSELEVETFTEDIFEISDGIVTLKEAKDEVKGVNDNFIVNASIDEIEQQDFNLNSKNYNKKVIIPGDGFELLQISDKFEFLNNGSRLADFKNSEGLYNFYTCSSEIYKCNESDINKYSIIIGHSGNGCLFKDINYSTLCTNHLLFNPNILLTNYTYYILKSLWELFFESCYQGSTVKNTSNKYISKFKLPIPTKPEQIQYWVDTISEPYDLKIENQNKVDTLEQEVQDRIQYIIEHEDCEEVELGELCEIKSGKFKSSDCKKSGLYPFYTGKSIQPEGFSDKYCIDIKENYIILIKDGGAGIKKYGEQIGLGKVFLLSGKAGLTCHQVAVYLKKKENIKYIYNYLKKIKNNIMDLAEYSTGLGTIKITTLKKIKIPIPKNKQLIIDLESKFQEIEQCQENVKTFEQQYEQKLKDLYQAAVKEIK